MATRYSHGKAIIITRPNKGRVITTTGYNLAHKEITATRHHALKAVIRPHATAEVVGEAIVVTVAAVAMGAVAGQAAVMEEVVVAGLPVVAAAATVVVVIAVAAVAADAKYNLKNYKQL
jgi:hypothetical protein